MFIDLADLMFRVREATSVAEVLPEEQTKMVDTHRSKLNAIPRKFSHQKFWLMNDGTVISVEREHDDVARWAGVDIKKLLNSGVIRGEMGYTDGEYPLSSYLSIEFWKSPTDEQIDVLVDFAGRYKLHNLLYDGYWAKETDVSGGGSYELKTPRHVEYIIRHGPIEEATLGDIRRKQRSMNMLFPTFDDRVKNVQLLGGVRLKDMDDDNWHFEVHSGTKKDVWYDCTLHFKNIQDVLEKLVKDRRLWVTDRSRVDLRKLAAAFIDRVDVQVFCSCPAFLYYGSSYILGRPKYDAKYTEPENRPPRRRNPKQYGAVCKHYHNVMKALPFYTGTVAKWLSDVYAPDIARYQKEMIDTLGWFKKAATDLGKREVGAARRSRRPRPARSETRPEKVQPDAGVEGLNQTETEGNTPEDTREVG